MLGHGHGRHARRVGDDDAEILGLEKEVLAQGVNEVMLARHVGEFLRDRPEDPLPQAVRVDNGAVLVRHGHLGVAVSLRVFEGVAADARDALVRVDVLLDGDLIRRPLLEVAAHAHVQPFGVLAHDDEVDFGVPLQGRKIRMQQRRRPEVHVQVEFEAKSAQEVAAVHVLSLIHI